jgi:prolyl oligopeptidase
MTRCSTWIVVLLSAGLPACTPADTSSTTDAEDPFLWLEEVEGAEALEWVEARNAETMATLGADERYDEFYDRTFEIITSTDRIAYPAILGDALYNFWTDAEHPRGIYRRTTWESYLSPDPEWELVLDIDQLAAEEGVPWDFDGMACLEPENRYCLARLSRGGSDAVEVREFDLVEKRFVPGGFRIPESKLSTAWVDADHVLVASALEGFPVTPSGYAASVRLWERGAPLEDAAVVTTVDEEELGAFVGNVRTPRGPEVVVWRQRDFYSGETLFYRDSELVRLDIPEDAAGFFVSGDQLVVQLVSDWEVDGEVYPEGAVVSAELEGFLSGDRALETMIAPGPRSTIDGVSTTRDSVLVNRLTDVQGQLLRFERAGGAWISEEIDVPPMGAVALASRSDDHNRFFFTFSSFLQPTTLYLAEEDGTITEVRTLPDQFDTAGLAVAQHWATSADGTEVPYFLAGPEDMALDGRNPTLLNAYGGFQNSGTPFYLGATGRNWVEDGGVFVLANIRGGGEFGPAWWKAALLENRQRAYDDFIAVSEDLIARGVTSPDHLGIIGGSNGGLLVGVAMTQRPDLYDAVVVQVPLLDMRRYHLLLAGASWMAEYGNPDIPDEWAYIREYSPYQNVGEDADYPTPFIWTTTRDDRVHPGHARKMAALMLSQGHPVHYFENIEGGHGSGVTPEQRARSSALTMAYLYRQLVEE